MKYVRRSQQNTRIERNTHVGILLALLILYQLFFISPASTRMKKYSRWLIFWGVCSSAGYYSAISDIPFHIPLSFDLSSESGSGKYRSAQF